MNPVGAVLSGLVTGSRWKIMQLRKRGNQARQSGRQSDASAVAPAPVCLSDLNVLPLWGPVLNADANAPLTLNQVRVRKLTFIVLVTCSHCPHTQRALTPERPSSHTGGAMYSHTQIAQEPSCHGNCNFEVAHCDVIKDSDLKSFCVW